MEFAKSCARIFNLVARVIARVIARAVALLISLATTLTLSSHARAEYRVFVLVITNTETNQSRVVTSTLDDIQYPGYYPLQKKETIAIQNTWMCWGRSDYYRKPCPNPRAPASTTAVPPPASTRDQ